MRIRLTIEKFSDKNSGKFLSLIKTSLLDHNITGYCKESKLSSYLDLKRERQKLRTKRRSKDQLRDRDRS